MKSQRLYRLHVTLPDGCDEYDWEPEGWSDDPQRYYRDPETGAMELSPFWWPSNKPYRSKSGAEGRAWLFQRYGATVEIEESEPVAWTGRRTPVRPNPRPEPVAVPEPAEMADQPF